MTGVARRAPPDGAGRPMPARPAKPAPGATVAETLDYMHALHAYNDAVVRENWVTDSPYCVHDILDALQNDTPAAPEAK